MNRIRWRQLVKERGSVALFGLLLLSFPPPARAIFDFLRPAPVVPEKETSPAPPAPPPESLPTCKIWESHSAGSEEVELSIYIGSVLRWTAYGGSYHDVENRNDEKESSLATQLARLRKEYACSRVYREWGRGNPPEAFRQAAPDGSAELPAGKCKVWEQHSPKSENVDLAVYVGRVLVWKPWSNYSNVADANSDKEELLARHLKKMQEAGQCYGIQRESGSGAPRETFLAVNSPPSSSGPKAPSPARDSGAPKAPKTLAVPDEKNGVLGAFSELGPGSGVFVGSRHLFEGTSEGQISRAFSGAGLKPEEYRCVQFVRQGTGAPGDPAGLQVLDLVLMIPKGRPGAAPASFDVQDNAPWQCQAEAGQPVPLRLRLSPELRSLLAGRTSLGDRYFSYEYGTVGAEAARTFSQGEVGSVGIGGRFYLPSTAGAVQRAAANRTTLRSSGSLVYTKTAGQSAWLVAGVVECLVPEQKGKDNNTGLDIPGATRVISTEVLQQAVAMPTSCTDPGLLAPRPRSKTCIPVDGRGGGGI